jgi:SAM-dependent methyltransferase
MSLLSCASRVYGAAVAIGLRTLLRGRLVEGLKQLIAPVGYWRVWPNAVVLAEADRLGVKKVLDVSSPKLPSLILGRHAEIWATDLDDPLLMSRWKVTADALGLDRYHAQYEDACRLSFADASFDLVYSISVIEHIPANGDAAALREFARVLRPGGKIIVEVPYRHQFAEIVQHYDSKGAPLETPRFYERYYDAAAVRDRLRAPEGTSIEQLWILGEWLPIDPWIATPRLPRLLRLLILPLEPLLALVNYWMRKDDSAGRPLAALVVYQKQ